MKVKKKDNIRYRFTGYVLAALKRAKRDYICREIKISNHESPLEKLLPEPLCDITDSKPFLWEETEQIPLIPDEVRQYMESQIGESGETRQLTYQEIGRHLGMDYKKAGSVFNYAKKKMRKGWKIRNEF